MKIDINTFEKKYINSVDVVQNFAIIHQNCTQLWNHHVVLFFFKCMYIIQQPVFKMTVVMHILRSNKNPPY